MEIKLKRKKEIQENLIIPYVLSLVHYMKDYHVCVIKRIMKFKFGEKDLGAKSSKQLIMLR